MNKIVSSDKDLVGVVFFGTVSMYIHVHVYNVHVLMTFDTHFEFRMCLFLNVHCICYMYIPNTLLTDYLQVVQSPTHCIANYSSINPLMV